MFAVAAPIGSVGAAVRGVSRARRASLVRAAAKGEKDVDWDAKTKRWHGTEIQMQPDLI